MSRPTTKSLIVYADDDPDDLELVREAFAGYSDKVEVLTFSNGAKVLSYLNSKTEETPCLIILDINMPIIDGRQVLRQIRGSDRYAEVPIVLFTTSSNPEDKIYAEKYRAGLITKPIEYQQMGCIADEFIGHCSQDIKTELRK